MRDYKTYSIKCMEKSNRILNTIREMFPNASCELNYNNLYELLVAVVLSAQTTDKRVNIVTLNLFKKYPTIDSLSKANYSDVYDIIKSLGLAKTKTTNIIALANALVNEFEGVVPNTREQLQLLPGVGRKTANAVLMEGFRIPAIAVDTHVSRVSNRLGLSNSNDVKKIEQDLMKLYDEKDWYFVHHGLLFFGRYFCLSQNPKCNECSLKDICTYENIIP